MLDLSQKGGTPYEKNLYHSIFICILFVLAACGTVSPKTQDTKEPEAIFVGTATTASTETKAEATTEEYRTEYVETYFIYADEGAVVTWFDALWLPQGADCF